MQSKRDLYLGTYDVDLAISNVFLTPAQRLQLSRIDIKAPSNWATSDGIVMLEPKLDIVEFNRRCLDSDNALEYLRNRADVSKNIEAKLLKYIEELNGSI